MSVARVATAAQNQYYLTQIQHAGNALDKTQGQIASGRNANTYAGFGDKTQVLTASIAANARNSAYTNATKMAVTQADLQDSQLTALANLAATLRKAVSDSVANADASALMTQAESIFDQAAAILNSRDANGDYIYSGGKTDVPPLTVNSLSQLAALPALSDAFANGADKKSVQVADGVTVSYGVAASDAATGLMQALSDLAQFNAGPSGNLGANITGAQNAYLSGAIATTAAVATDLNNVVAQNGFVYNRLTDAQDQQASMNTLYKSFISDIQDTNMAEAATQLSLNQTQLQAALSVTAQLNQLTLLNFLQK
jgi:flagellar hook-associated protein 3 FlgL